jgi:glucokinase
MAERYWIGVDLGGTKILTGLFNDSFQLISKAKQATGAEQGGPAVLDRIVQAVEQLIKDTSTPRELIAGMGLAVPGQVVIGTKVVRFAPNLGWTDFDLGKMLPENWKWNIVLENDVRMGTFGEWKHGAAQGAKHVFGTFVGTGVGGGLILNGEIYHGFLGHAGEFGHIVLHWRKGTELESIAGRKYIMQRAVERLADVPKKLRKEWRGVDPLKMKSSQLADFFAKSDPIAVQLIDDAARALGAGIASVINFLSPEVVIVGGGVASALGESFLERIWEFTTRSTLPGATEGVRFTAASLGDDAGIYGSAAYAKHQFPHAQ